MELLTGGRTTPQPIGVALIGAGMIAKTHVAALSAIHDKARLEAIAARHPDQAHPLAMHYAGKHIVLENPSGGPCVSGRFRRRGLEFARGAVGSFTKCSHTGPR